MLTEQLSNDHGDTPISTLFHIVFETLKCLNVGFVTQFFLYGRLIFRKSDRYAPKALFVEITIYICFILWNAWSMWGNAMHLVALDW